MRYIIDHDFHIHSKLSICSEDPNQTPENILKYAKENGFKKIILTDHYWDEKVDRGDIDWFYKEQPTDHIKEALPLPCDNEVEFLFGAETELSYDLIIGATKETIDELDFIIIPTTHLHFNGFTIKTDDGKTSERRAELWVERLDFVLNQDLPFHKVGIAHLSCCLMANISREFFLETLKAIPEKEMERLFKKAADLGVGIELNGGDFRNELNSPDLEDILKMFRIAKKQGCKFYFGTDAHSEGGYKGAREMFEKLVDLLELTEEDKFYLK